MYKVNHFNESNEEENEDVSKLNVEDFIQLVKEIEDRYVEENINYSLIKLKLDELKEKYTKLLHLLNDRDLILLENIQLECLNNLDLYIEAYLSIGTFYLLDSNVRI